MSEKYLSQEQKAHLAEVINVALDRVKTATGIQEKLEGAKTFDEKVQVWQCAYHWLPVHAVVDAAKSLGSEFSVRDVYRQIGDQTLSIDDVHSAIYSLSDSKHAIFATDQRNWGTAPLHPSGKPGVAQDQYAVFRYERHQNFGKDPK